MAACSGMVHLRRAREDDARGIAEVHVGTWRHAYRDLLPPELLAGLNVGSREQWWRTELGVVAQERRPWIAESDGRVVGFVSHGPSRDGGSPTIGEIYAIYVAPECWDRGVGRNLLSHGMRDLLAHGYDEATLWVLAGNQRARAFYEAAGWQADGGERLDEIGGQQLAEVRYRRSVR